MSKKKLHILHAKFSKKYFTFISLDLQCLQIILRKIDDSKILRTRSINQAVQYLISSAINISAFKYCSLGI